MNTRLLGIGFCSLALAGAVTALTLAQPPQPGGKPAPKPEAKQPEAKPAEKADGDVEIKIAEAPEPVRAAIAKLTPADKVKKVLKETEDGVTTFEVEYTEGGLDCSAALTAAGDVMEIEKGMKDTALPAAATAALKKAYPGATFKDMVAVQKFYFEVEVVINGKGHGVRVDAAGQIEDEHHEADKEKAGEKHEGKKGDKDDDDD